MAAVRFSVLANPTVIVTAIVYALLLRMGAVGGILGLMLVLAVLLSLFRYGYSVLRHIANGWNRFPPPDIESMNIFGQWAVVLHSLLFVVLLILLGTTPFIDAALRWPLLFIVAAAFPASAAIMAMTRNVGAALRPANVVSLIGDLGIDYVKLLAVSVLLFSFRSLASGWSWYLGLVADILGVWTLLALFLATGATLRAHRTELDLVEGLDDAEQREQRFRQAEWQKTLDRAYASVRSGLQAQGYRTIKDLIDDEGDSLEIYQWTFNGMLAWDDPKHAVLLGERFAARLWQAGRKFDALELAQRCRKLSPSFVPPTSFAIELAAYAREIGRHRLADDLTSLAGTAPPTR